MKPFVIFLRQALTIMLGASLYGCAETVPTPRASINPSHAVHSISSPDNYLLIKPEYTLSYNKSEGTPNWVEWQLDSHDLGREHRSNAFHEEDSLPSGWRVEPEEYRGSGFDRGHLCPSGDRTADSEDNFQTFSMANMVPQSPDNNRGPWEKLEKYERRLAKQGMKLTIIAGRIGEGGTGSHGTASKVYGTVSVPHELWKVIIAKNGGEVTRIAVIMPNTQGIKETSWKQYQTSVGQIESETGYDLHTGL